MTSRIADNIPVGAQRPDIACPACGAQPVAGMQWLCAPDGCGGTFDTFASHGRCPHCDAQFSWTQCLMCGRISAHQAFYLQPRNDRGHDGRSVL